MPVGQEVDERLVGVGLGVGLEDLAPRTPSVGAEQEARMPRGIGARTGVKLTVDVLPAGRRQVLDRSPGVCRCTPPTP